MLGTAVSANPNYAEPCPPTAMLHLKDGEGVDQAWRAVKACSTLTNVAGKCVLLKGIAESVSSSDFYS